MLLIKKDFLTNLRLQAGGIMKLNIKYSAIFLLLVAQNSFALDDLFIGYESDRQDYFGRSTTNYSNTISASSDPITVSLISNPTFILNFDLSLIHI